MGRRAKYFTQDERRQGSALKAALLAAKPRRVARNREQYLRGKGRRLLIQDAPIMPKDIVSLAQEDVSEPAEHRVFQQFCQGRNSLGFDEIDLEEEDFDGLTGQPPYPPAIVTLPTFYDIWPVVSAALHGFWTRCYINECEVLISSLRQTSELQTIVLCYKQHRRLTRAQSEVEGAHLAFERTGDWVKSEIAWLNGKWIARQIGYKVEEIKALRDGEGAFVRVVAERMWKLGLANIDRSPSSL